jgi:hypothetical protein
MAPKESNGIIRAAYLSSSLILLAGYENEVFKFAIYRIIDADMIQELARQMLS